MKARRSGPTFIQRSRAKSPEEKALYHNVAGAGRSRVLREFFGLTTQDEDALFAALQQRVDRALRQYTR